MSDKSDFDDVMALGVIVAELIATLERKGLLDAEDIKRLLDDALYRNEPSADRTNTASLLANTVNAFRAHPVPR